MTRRAAGVGVSFLLLVVSGVAVQASAPDAPLPPEALRLERALANVTALRAEFVQIREVALTGERIEGRGLLAFRPPDDFRLAYQTPEPQEMVIVGDSLWVVMPVENQAQRYPFDPHAPGNEVFLLFGAKDGSLAGAFHVVQEPWASEKATLRLEPRLAEPGYPIEEIRLVLAPDGLPARLFLRESSGDEVVFRFRTFEKNPEDIERSLALHLPPGIEIIDASPPARDRGLPIDPD